MKTNFSNMHYNNFKHPIRIIALRIYSIHIFHRIINGTKDLESWVKFRIGRPLDPKLSKIQMWQIKPSIYFKNPASPLDGK